MMAQVLERVAAIRDDGRHQRRVRAGILTEEQARELAEVGVHRYNHNLETARSLLPAGRHHPHVGGARDTCQLVRAHGMELCCGALLGMGETVEQRIELARAGRGRSRRGADQLPEPAAGHAARATEPLEPIEAMRGIALFRLALPRPCPALRRRPRGHARDLAHARA